MSELKSVYIDRTGDWVRSGNDTGKFYLKSEADKVIADLESRNTQLRKDKANLLCNNENLKLEIKSQKLGRLNDKLQYNITERHHKYKRCLAMYRYCTIRALYELDFKGNDVKWKWYSKWMHKWFNLAKKFKEAK